MKSKTIAGITMFACIVRTLTACENPATGKTEAEVGDTDPNAMTTEVIGRELLISPAESNISWVGSKVTGSHDGGFKSFEGTITLGEGGPTESRVEVLIDATSIFADNDKNVNRYNIPTL